MPSALSLLATPTRVTALLVIMLLAGCGESPQDPALARELKPIGTGDECHVCGMLITNFPGPKAQAFIRNRDEALKFCSTVDLFSWLLQPETPAVLESAHVHDMSASDWAHPSEDRYVEARQAWYVAGHTLPGAMGPTLASFSTREAAEQFARSQGGQTLPFADINLELLASLSAPADHHHPTEHPAH